MSSFIIGLNGLAGCGKTTAAKHLIEAHKFTRVRFADPLKAMCRALGLSEADVDGETKETPNPLLRPFNFDLLLKATPKAFAAIGVDFHAPGYATPDQLCGRNLDFAVAAFLGVLAQTLVKGEKAGGATPRLLMQLIGTEWGRDLIHKDIWTNLWRDRIQGVERVVADDCRFPNEVQALRANGGLLVEIVRPSNTLNVGTHESEAHRFEPDVKLKNEAISDFLIAIDGLVHLKTAQAA